MTTLLVLVPMFSSVLSLSTALVQLTASATGGFMTAYALVFLLTPPPTLLAFLRNTPMACDNTKSLLQGIRKV